MIRWLRARLHIRRAHLDPEGARRALAERDRESWKLWKLRTPPLPRR